MDTKVFTKQSPGQIVSAMNGLQAFVPEALPSNAFFSNKLWPLLAEAREKTALLEGIGRTLPDPGLLLRPVIDRESIKSSSLEGTYVTATELLMYEIEPGSNDDAGRHSDQREVLNYRHALEHGTSSELPICLRLIRDLHRILMTGVRGKDRTPGEFRRQQVAIGENLRFVPPPVPEHLKCLDQFEKYLNAPSNFDPLIDCFLCHYQFETIHPFTDGNGRVGRLLLAMMLQRRCKLSKPWLYLSEYFERNKDSYCSHLFNVSAKGDWYSWLKFCLEATVSQAVATVERCERLRQLHAALMARLAKTKRNVRLTRIVERLFVSPFLRITDVAKHLGVSLPTAKSDLERLEEVQILSRFSSNRRVTFYSREVFDAAYSDIDIPPS